MKTDREEFEAWVSASPYELCIGRFPDVPEKAWPGQYRDINVQRAWEAWQAARAGMVPAKYAGFSFGELTREISSRSISQLPALTLHIILQCSIKPVFKDKEAMLSFVGRAWDMGGVGQAELRSETYQPEGTKFFSQSMQKEMILIESGPHTGWIAYKHPDGQFVSLRVATKNDLADIANAKKATKAAL